MKIKKICFVFFLLSCSYLTFGQNKITITGTVTDADKSPVAGAAIFIDKVKANSITDQKGYYEVKVKSDAEEILVFTLFNGAAVTKINGRTSIDFVLLPGNPATDETTVNEGAATTGSGSGTSDKKDVPVEIGKVDGQDPSFASYTDIYEMIHGRFPGVQVTGHSIKINGSTSLNVSTEPLFVVDGVIVNSVDGISPQTVKYIEVLKGPEASVYGMRGSNGVIVITRITGKDKN